MDTQFSTINGVAWMRWQVKTVTPLCIKAGTTSVWNQSTQPKTRQVKATFDFFNKTLTQHTIADFYYDVFINDINSASKLSVRYTIPPSSVRGALRGFTIRALVKREWWNAFLYPDECSGESDLKASTNDPGWQLVRNLFGLAWDMDEDISNPTIAGRLRVMVEGPPELPEEDIKSHLESEGFNIHQVQYPSRNGRMCFTTRNPLDRITQAAKAGGLHSFMELAPGNSFTIKLCIVNPEPTDIGLLGFWEDAIDSGRLRLGGLTAAGRGRLKITEKEINLYLRDSGRPNGSTYLKKENGGTARNEILAGLFTRWTISNEDWGKAREDYLNILKEHYKTLSQNKEGTHGSLHESL